MKKICLALLTVLPLFTHCISEHAEHKTVEDRLTQYVNPFMGTDGPGNTYPGATVPFGMVQLSPDIGIPGWDRIAGYYYPDTIISGFSHMHLSGTGAGDLYDILLMPFNSASHKTIKENGYRPYSLFNHTEESAEPGYYQVLLQDFNINAELSATAHCGIHQYTFPKDEQSGFIVDLGYALNWDAPTDTYLMIEDSTTLVGYRFSKGWAPDQRVFFVVQFSKPFTRAELFKEGEIVLEPTVKSKHTKIKTYFSTGQDEKVVVKVGLSTASIEGARFGLQQEVPDWDFEKVRQNASDNWEEQLAKIKIKSPSNTLKQTFYTALYQSMLAPTLLSDAQGKYKGADGNYHVAEGYNKYDTFSLWDTFRAAHPLYTIMHPERVRNMVQSMLSHYQETGLSPVWSMQGNETNMMIGYHAVPVIVDAYLKGIGGFDPELAYEACTSNAMSNDHGIKEYRESGFVPISTAHENWSVSKTLEYAYDDWCIAQFAKALGKEQDYLTFSTRANNWQNHYDPSSMFMRPKYANGSFLADFVPKEYTSHFCESNAWHYFWFVPHDVEGLIQKVGGPESFEAKLDSFFTLSPLKEDKLPIFSTGMIGQYAHGNEPSHHVSYLYNFINKPWKTQQRVRQILETQYHPIPNGHCGNEDCGQMSAWYVLSSLGFYPVNPASGEYSIGTPLWEEAEISLSHGKTFVIVANNASKENVFIQSVHLNDVLLDVPFITHQQLMDGGKLVFTMGHAPNEKLWAK